ncbi:cytokine receptor-like factor 2 [Rousettus aegyptiacus]|uniref:cytokine receptor-like factor 2 n=1 Tax=Rousettus aegyptiacus TaxID=9407 RepID=UPI00168D1E28|nr:cytokine receptor-like factor 2 [Rousettus aegyptiacus]
MDRLQDGFGVHSGRVRGRAGGHEDALQLHIVNFNFETVDVTWNVSEVPGANVTLLYTFCEDDDCSQRADYGQCGHYILRRGRTAGCRLDAQGDSILRLSLWDGAAPLLNHSVWISEFLKPRSPARLSFQWQEDSVTVTCSDLPFRSLLYEVQHRSTFDSEWQSREEETCRITMEGLDADKCYFFRARVRTDKSIYGPDTYPSDWSDVAHLQNGELRDSCRDRALFPKFVLISAAVVLTLLSLLLLLLWKLRSVRKLLMPSVPDPKASFPGLFDAHRGDFQEWIHDTQNVAVLSKVEHGERACVVEDAPGVPLPAAPAPARVTPAGAPDAAGQPGQPRGQPPPGKDEVCLAGFTFLIGDNAYVTL